VWKSRVLCLLVVLSTRLHAADSVFAPLWLYDGGWQVAPKNIAAGAKPDQLLNECKQVGMYFTCQQTVNGKAGALLIFIPTEKKGHYYTQNVRPEGFASGRGDLDIEGDRWTYLSRALEDGKSKYYRTQNVFNGKDHIHYESSESSDGSKWTVTNSGDEVRAHRAK
jgi:hypothetical protein